MTASDIVDVAWISGQQRMFLQLLARGFDVRGIARETRYSYGHVYAQLREAREALGAQTMVAMVVEGLRWGVIVMPEEEEMKFSDE